MNKMTGAILGGIAGTAVMTGFMMVSPSLGFPEIHPAEVMASVMDIPILAGWGVYFLIGIIFAFAYAMLFINWLDNINNNTLKGVAFGMIVWVIAQGAFIVTGVMIETAPGPPPEGIAMMITGNILNHILFGSVVAMFVKTKV